MENTNPDTFFPQEIINLILVSLPVKSLFRFRSVCKLWLSIISTPSFIKAHQDSMSTKDPRLILADAPFDSQDNYQHLEFSTCSLYNLQNDLLTDEPVTETIEGNFNSVVGYCINGLVCLVSDDDFRAVLWNPSTRKSRRLPKIDMAHYYVCYGFCYDECNDDFKVFAIYSDDDCAFEYKVSVYSSKSDSWRVIGDLPFNVVCGNGVFANRAIYWEVYADDFFIISFDIKTETYRQVLQPKYDLEETPCWKFGNFGNSLYVLYDLDTYADLWVIKEFDPKESWTKLVTVQYYDGLVTNFRDIRPICIFENGVIMLNLRYTLVLYNSKDNTFKDLLEEICYERLYVYSYVESLVSP